MVVSVKEGADLYTEDYCNEVDFNCDCIGIMDTRRLGDSVPTAVFTLLGIHPR